MESQSISPDKLTIVNDKLIRVQVDIEHKKEDLLAQKGFFERNLLVIQKRLDEINELLELFPKEEPKP